MSNAAPAPKQQDEPEAHASRAEIRVTSRGVTNFLLGGLLILGVIFTLYFGKQFILPVVLAILFNYLLSPIVRGLLGFGVPRPVSAIVLIFGLLALTFVGSYYLAQPALEFFSEFPERLRAIEYKFRDIIHPMQQIAEAAEEIDEATSGAGGPEQAVTVRGPGLLEIAFGYAQSVGAGALITVILLLFLLSLDEIFLHKLVRVMPTLRDKKRAVEITRQIERDVSRYLLTITVINTLMGLAVGFALWLLGVDDPMLWGVFVGVMNYIPYLGSVVSLLVLSIVSIASFDSPWQMLWPPLAFLVINTIEAYVVTPRVLGSRLDLNPVILLISLAFWGFIWGITGMLIAVPLLVIMKLISDHFESLSPLSEFLTGTPRAPEPPESPKSPEPPETVETP